jgi:hypothetical protein
MPTSLYRCPRTGQLVQAWFADDGIENGGQHFESTKCLACASFHFVNHRTGDVLDRGPFRVCTIKDAFHYP